ncbi:mitochondrial 5-aminolevulinate synthase [Hypoxylon texense]
MPSIVDSSFTQSPCPRSRVAARLAQMNPDANIGVPSGLEFTHPLPPIDQTVGRRYVYRMFTFDFPDTSDAAVHKAMHSISLGVTDALKDYSFLTGRLGPLYHPSKHNLIQVRYGDEAYTKSMIPQITRLVMHDDKGGSCYKKLCTASMPVSHWNMESFCAAPRTFDLSEWPPVFTMQTNFLISGGLGIIIVSSQYAYRSNIDSLERFRYWSGDKADPDPDSPVTCIFKMPKRVAAEWADTLQYVDGQHLTVADCVATLFSVEISKASYAESNASAKGTTLITAMDARNKLTLRASESCLGNILAITSLMIPNDEIVPGSGSSTTTKR